MQYHQQSRLDSEQAHASEEKEQRLIPYTQPEVSLLGDMKEQTGDGSYYGYEDCYDYYCHF
jgi:hypothetical protein